MNQHEKDMAQIKANHLELERMFLEDQKRLEAWKKEMVAWQKKQKALQKKYEEDREINRKENAKRRAEIDAQLLKATTGLTDVRKQVNGISESNGMFSEEYFVNTLGKSFRFCGVLFDIINHGMSRKKRLPGGENLEGEYDVVMENGDTVALIEIKYRVRMGDALEMVERQLEQFKALYPEYANFRFFLGLAGFSFERGTQAEAIRLGVGLLLPKGENVKIIDKHAKEY